MTKEETKAEISKKIELKEANYMMGSKAYHQLGDLSREPEDLFIAGAETEKFWIGNWITGFGFFNVCFPKETSRPLTPEEVEKYNKTYIQIGSNPLQKLKVD